MSQIRVTGIHLVMEQVRKSQAYYHSGDFCVAAALMARAKVNLKRMNKWGDNPVSARVEALLRVMTEKSSGVAVPASSSVTSKESS